MEAQLRPARGRRMARKGVKARPAQARDLDRAEGRCRQEASVSFAKHGAAAVRRDHGGLAALTVGHAQRPQEQIDHLRK